MQLLLAQARGYILLAKQLQESGIDNTHYVFQAQQIMLRYKRLNDETIELKLVA